ncbi:MAG TPA: glycosyltransferase [Pyrinomonadaceae bacterium]|nr:glycosyltransferase [Pyrinomonadaceae bacterium]
MPKVSVITAAYNHVQFIRQSVESVQAQTYRDFEHIVIDDGSSDGTATILESFGNQISYVRQENSGAHASINRGIRMSSGEYIAVVDSDDAWLPNKLELQVAMLEAAPDAGMVYSLAYFIDSDGNRHDESWLMGTPFDDASQIFEELLQRNRIPVVTALMRRKCLDDVGFFSEKFKALSDWDLWLRFCLKYPVLFIPEMLALYRVHQTNSWHELSGNGRVAKERLMLLRNAGANLPGSMLDDPVRRRKIRLAFGDCVLYATYDDLRHHRYNRALQYLFFAGKLRPTFLVDVLLAARSHPTLLKELKVLSVGPKAVLGNRGLEMLQSVRRLLN